MSDDHHLLTSDVPRTLETKNKIMGLELGDVLLLLLNISVQNLIFGATPFKIPMVLGTSSIFGLIMFFVKRGKPDHYIQHKVEYMVQPSVFEANKEDSEYLKFVLSQEGVK